MGQQRVLHFRSVACIVLLPLALHAGSGWARPTSSQEAELVVAGWRAESAEPFGARLGIKVADVRIVAAATGVPVYYVVHLSPGGFVVVSADDFVEPILAFTDAETFELSPGDPLAELIARDLTRRLTQAYAGSPGGIRAQSAPAAPSRWYELMARAGALQDELGILGQQTVSDVRITPFVKSRWAQGEICTRPGYNYYTPNHYPAGCAATSIAQVMYYYRRPADGVGQQSFTIRVADANQVALTRGGDGLGGPYRWDDMVAVPSCETTADQREAIGALCYDAGIATRTSYTRDGSSADAFVLADTLRKVFGFSNAINGASEGRNITGGLAGMVNPNLDAHYPVILGITGTTGHAVVVDGYGYDSSTQVRTLYHHLNMGWGGYNDLWYNLPDALDYDTIVSCIYNIFIEGKGEIISGRVVDTAGRPVPGAVVQATLRTRAYAEVTDKNGIYALVKVPSASAYSITAQKLGYFFTRQSITVGTSRNWGDYSGNRWSVDFIGRLAADSDRDNDVDFVDFARLAAGWQMTADAENPSWVSSYLDLMALARNWLTGATPHQRP
jgi:hypothetical protein